MSIDNDSEQRGVHVAATASTPTARSQCEIKRAEIQKLREHLYKVQAGDDDEDTLLAALALPVGTTDPLSCFCCCNFKRLGQSYILHERRVLSADGSTIENKLVIVGPHWIGVIVTLGIILVSTAMFLSQHIRIMAWYNTLIVFGLCGMTLYYLFQTTLTDPGIIHSLGQLNETEIEDESATIEMEGGQLLHSKEMLASRKRSLRRRYCDICGITQDSSTDHCEDCGVCVAGYDHHCPWMGKCIGRDNMHAFKMFNMAWIMYVCFVLVIAITHMDWGQTAVNTLKHSASGNWGTSRIP